MSSKAYSSKSLLVVAESRIREVVGPNVVIVTHTRFIFMGSEEDVETDTRITALLVHGKKKVDQKHCWGRRTDVHLVRD